MYLLAVAVTETTAAIGVQMMPPGMAQGAAATPTAATGQITIPETVAKSQTGIAEPMVSIPTMAVAVVTGGGRTADTRTAGMDTVGRIQWPVVGASASVHQTGRTADTALAATVAAMVVGTTETEGTGLVAADEITEVALRLSMYQ